MKGRSRRHAAILAFALASVLGPVAIVTANTFPNNYDHRVADDAIHTYCLTSSYVLEEHKVVPEYAMYWLDATTDMSDQAQSCLSYTDVWWYKTDLPAGYRGQRTCAVVGDIPSVCDRSNVHLDFAEIDIGGLDWEDRRKTACHELGHTIGLGEEPGTVYCMVQGDVPNANETYRRYSSHDITSHINVQY
jgi:hypothetical protein